MDNVLLLTAMLLMPCRLMLYIVNTVFADSIFPGLSLFSWVVALDMGAHIQTYIGFSSSE